MGEHIEIPIMVVHFDQRYLWKILTLNKGYKVTLSLQRCPKKSNHGCVNSPSWQLACHKDNP